jgi:hypothetical protein
MSEEQVKLAPGSLSPQHPEAVILIRAEDVLPTGIRTPALRMVKTDELCEKRWDFVGRQLPLRCRADLSVHREQQV